MWVKLDDAYYDHDKIVRAGPVAELLWVRSLAWCNRNRQDGVIPAGALCRLAEFCPRLTLDGDSVSPLDLAEVLVREGMWSAHPGGWEIHDYGNYQRSAADIEDLRAKRSAAGRKGAEARWGDTSGNEMASAMASAQQPEWQTDAPVPGPDPEGPLVNPVDEPGTSPQAEDRRIPEAVWAEYARLKRCQARDVRNPSRYERMTAKNAKEDPELVQTASRWLAMFEVSPNELAAGLVSGNASTYWARRKETSR